MADGGEPTPQPNASAEEIIPSAGDNGNRSHSTPAENPTDEMTGDGYYRPNGGASANWIPPSDQNRAPASSMSAPSSAGTIDLPGAIQQGLRGIKEEQAVSEQKAAADQLAISDDINGRQQLLNDQKTAFDDHADQQRMFLNDYMNGHINPNHYVENMSVPGKIATAIGLMLGGAGAHSTGGVNMAQQFLGQQIDRDISAQQSRMEQQKTLLGANQALYHDKVLALNQTKLNMNDILDRQIQMNAAKVGTPQAKAIADQQSANFKIQNAALLQQSAIRSSVLKNIQSGNPSVNGIDLGHAGLVPPEEAAKEQKEVDAYKNTVASINSLFDQYDKEQTVGNLLNPQSHERANQLGSSLVNAMMEVSPTKRLTKETAEMEINPNRIGTFDTQKTRDHARANVLEMASRHAGESPYLDQYGIGVNSMRGARKGPAFDTNANNGIRYDNQGNAYKLGPNGKPVRVN